MSDNDRREIKQVYSKTTRQMIALPPEARPTVAAYKRFKTPAFSIPTRRKEDKGERKTTEG